MKMYMRWLKLRLKWRRLIVICYSYWIFWNFIIVSWILFSVNILSCLVRWRRWNGSMLKWRREVINCRKRRKRLWRSVFVNEVLRRSWRNWVENLYERIRSWRKIFVILERFWLIVMKNCIENWRIWFWMLKK